MSQLSADQLPDPSSVETAALLIIHEAPSDWVKLDYVMWYIDEDVADSKLWSTSANGERQELMPPDADVVLSRLRSAQIDAGHEPWLRADIVVNREPESMNPDFTVDFSYDVRDIPE
jgi:hypothetical protein